MGWESSAEHDSEPTGDVTVVAAGVHDAGVGADPRIGLDAFGAFIDREPVLEKREQTRRGATRSTNNIGTERDRRPGIGSSVSVN